MMDNDKLETDSNQTTVIIEGLDTDTEGDDDIHFCKKCKLMFVSLEDYLQHKVKHDNFKVTLSRTSDHKHIVPKLVQKPEKLKKDSVKEDGAEKENHRRGRKRKKAVLEEVNKDLFAERPSYSCTKCNVKFNREATLRRHIEWVHNQEEENIKLEEGDSDEDVKPNLGHQQLPIVTESQTEEVEEEETDPTYQVQKAAVEDNSERPYCCQICAYRFKEIYALKAHMLTHSNKRDFVCTYEGCTYAFKTKGALKRHVRRHTGERPFRCYQCGRCFTESGALSRHLKSRVSCQNKSDYELPRYGKRWSLAAGAMNNMRMADCSQGQVGAVPTTNIGMPIAVGTDINQPQTETECAVAEVIATDDNIVIEESVGNIEDVVAMETQEILAAKEFLETPEILTPTQCKVCKEDFLSFDVLKIHLRTHLVDVPFKCSLCHFVAEKRDQLSSHMISLHQNQLRGSELLTHIPVSTDVSNGDDKEEQSRVARIAVRQLLEIPSTSAEDLEPTVQQDNAFFKCPVCSRPFKSNNYLKLHMKMHTGEQPYKCPECDKTFVLKDSLTKHLPTHNENRNYRCGTCGKLFKRMSHVKEHLKIHSVSRPFPCTICNKSFKTNNAMKVHLRTHTSILPYICTFCRRRFREKGSLQRHQRMHTGERPFQCQHCNRCFAEHGTLNRHLKAKVPCSSQLQLSRNEAAVEQDTEEMTVLAEFSNVVADTQQYMVSEEEQTDKSQTEETETEYVVVQNGDFNVEGLQNVKIVTEGEVDGSFLQGVQVADLEGVQITEDYVLVTEDSENVKIVNTRTGETLATMLPLSSLNEGDSQIVTLQDEENEITAVAITPDSENITTNKDENDTTSTYQIETVIHPSHNEIEAVAMAPNVDVQESVQIIYTNNDVQATELS